MKSKVLAGSLIVFCSILLNSCFTKVSTSNDRQIKLNLQASFVLDKNGKDVYLEATLDNLGEKSVVLHIVNLDLERINLSGEEVGGYSSSVFINGQDLSQESCLEQLLPHSRIYQKLFLRSMHPIDQTQIQKNNPNYKVMVVLVGTLFGVLDDPVKSDDNWKIVENEISK